MIALGVSRFDARRNSLPLGEAIASGYKRSIGGIVMGTMERITVSLPADMAAALRQSIEHGDYRSESEIVGEALQDWAALRKTNDDRLRAAVADARNGPWVPADTTFAKLRARMHERLAQR